jgi:hypothetical protein
MRGLSPKVIRDGLSHITPLTSKSMNTGFRCTNDNCHIGHGKSLNGHSRPHSIMWNRDVNASYNMAVILYNLLTEGSRPNAFLRSSYHNNFFMDSVGTVPTS